MMAKLERSPQQARMEAVSRDALVQAALQEITKNYREASLSNVARAYGVSLAYVSECVRAQTGRTYKELLQKHRMETAARLLRRSDLNIQQIIAQVGYENTSYFYRLFHERYGLLWHPDCAERERLSQVLLRRDGFWPSFAYLAAWKDWAGAQ